MGTKKIKIGDHVRDPITGFEGIVVATTNFLHGCTRCGVRSQNLHEGKPIESQWFDEPQLTRVKAKAIKQGKRINGGPMSVKPKRNPDHG